MKLSYITFCMLLLLFGCNFTPNSGSEPRQPSQNLQVALTGIQPRQVQTEKKRSPVKLYVGLDKSLSTNTTRVQQPRLDEFQPVIEHLRQNGGELGVGTICNNSNESLVRLRIEKQPVPPSKPAEPSNDINPLKLPEAQEDYQQKIAAYQQQIIAYKQEKKQWFESKEQKINQFKVSIKQLLNKPVNCDHTDIWGAVNRADLFLAEADTFWGQPTQRYALFISDGIDDVKAKFLPQRSKAKVILVNGSASVGSMAILKPELFESTTAAFEYIVAEGGK